MKEKTSLDHAISMLELDGYVVHKVVKSRTKLRDRWISIGEDLFSCFDLLALHPSHLPKLVQVTGYASSAPASQRRAKILAWVQESFSGDPGASEAASTASSESQYRLPASIDLEVWAWTPNARGLEGMHRWKLETTGWERLACL